MSCGKPPTLNGLTASIVHLPQGDWVTVLDCLCDHFAAIDREQWLSRMARGRVLDAACKPITPSHPYRAGLCIHYYREVATEAPIPFVETILHADGHLVVVDKPHFLPVMPRGPHVEETLAARLIRRLGNPDLVPLHRIDRGTAGLVLFSANPTSRRHYQALFRTRRIAKCYEALAPPLPNTDFPLTRRSRLVSGEPFFRMREIEGEANSESHIDVLCAEGYHWRYMLRPVTGKQHQLRVHMAALGAAIVNDPLYPTLMPESPGDYSMPLKLLAKGLEFIDPLNGTTRRFASQFTLRPGG